jgi:hypothetical protein
LSNKLEIQAEDELRETEEIRQHSIKTIREWTLKHPKIIKSRLDSNFILRYLRFRKFSIPMATEAIERFLVLKNGSYGDGWLDNLNVNRSSIMKLVDDG